MTSYQQVPIGIPVAYPYPSHPYSQDFPNEADPESSQVQDPSLNHNQQYYPQYLYQGQPQVAIGQPGQVYHQPAQYVMVAGLPPLDPEKINLERKIRGVDEMLNSGWYFAYKAWLYFIIGCCSFFGFFVSLAFVVGSFLYACNFEDRTETASVLVIHLIFLTWCIWLLRQCLLVKNAMLKRSSEGARRGMKLMLRFSIYYFVTFFLVLLFKDFTSKGKPNFRSPRFPSDVCSFVILYIIPTFLQIFGATRVIELLAQRETLVMEFSGGLTLQN